MTAMQIKICGDSILMENVLLNAYAADRAIDILGQIWRVVEWRLYNGTIEFKLVTEC
jgi:hypothetical protein